MKKLFLISFLFSLLILTVDAIGEGNYGNDTFGNSTFGISSLAQFVFTDTLAFTANTPVTIDTSNSTNATLELTFNFDTEGFITIVQYNELPLTVGPAPDSSLNKFIDVAISDSLITNLNHSILILKYSDAEVSDSNLQESTLRLYKWDGVNWIKFDGTGVGGVNTADNVVFANTTSFSTWGIFGSAIPTPDSAVEGGENLGGVSGTGGGGGCIYNWQCTEWSLCSIAVEQTRTCTNIGTCAGDYGKPVEVSNCVYSAPEIPDTEIAEEEEEIEGEIDEIEIDENTGFLNGITSGAILNLIGRGNPKSGAAILILIILFGIILYKRVFNKNKP